MLCGLGQRGEKLGLHVAGMKTEDTKEYGKGREEGNMR